MLREWTGRKMDSCHLLSCIFLCFHLSFIISSSISRTWRLTYFGLFDLSALKKNNLLLFFYLHKKDIPETSGRVRDVQVVSDLEELVSVGFHLKDRVGIVHHRAGVAGRTWEDRLLHSVKAEHLGNHHKEVLMFFFVNLSFNRLL